MVDTVRSLLVAFLASAVVGCGAGQAGLDTDDIATPLPNPLPAIMPADEALRGVIVNRRPVDPPLEDPGDVIGAATIASYRTVSGIDGGPREVSGVFVVPSGRPPVGGWPMVSMAHGTTGIGSDCGPSMDQDLMGFLPTVRDLASHGYAIALTDYEGLSGTGVHPYLEPRTAAFNVIDAARALRNLDPGVSDRWIALGNSQGGQAVWAAGEIVAAYGAEGALAGVVAISPAVNLTPIAQRGAEGRLTADQRSVLPMLVAGLERFDPALRARNLINDNIRSDEDAVFACHADSAGPAVLDVQLGDGDDVRALRDGLRRIALPQRRLAAPMLVLNGLSDDTVDASWVAAAVQQACELDGHIQHVEVVDAGHGDLGPTAYRLLYQWMADSFASADTQSNCGQAAHQVDFG